MHLHVSPIRNRVVCLQTVRVVRNVLTHVIHVMCGVAHIFVFGWLLISVKSGEHKRQRAGRQIYVLPINPFGVLVTAGMPIAIAPEH